MDSIERRGYDNGIVIGGRYRIVGLIGRGGMGEVYAAEDLRLQGKLRALKVNKPPTAEGLYSAEEAALLMRLNHPRLPFIVDYFPPDDEGREMLVMDYIDGETLQAHVMANGGGIMLETTVLDIGIQLCEALSYLHSQNPPIIHRDLKPTNVMVDQSGYVRLIDFGIARRYKNGQYEDTVKLGTPGFAPPEQEGTQQSDARTDVFGLGALLFYLLSGGQRLLNGALPGSSPLPHVSTSFCAVLGRMLDPEPNCRYSSMEEAGSAIKACLLSHSQSLPSSEGILKNLQSNRRSDRGERSFNVSNLPGNRSALELKQPTKPLHITVASLSPGAGATFVAITLARLLAMRGVECAAVEHPALEPEWHALLNLKHQASAAGASQPLDTRFMRGFSGRHDQVLWHALLPFPPMEGANHSLKFKLMMDAMHQSVVVTDVSGKWTELEVEHQLLNSGILLFIVDPLPFKWTPHRLKAAQAVCIERDKIGLPTYWAANKNMKFRQRAEWLAMIPSKLVLSIPLLPPEEWTELIWNGEWATSNKSWLKALERSYSPFIGNLFARS